MMDICDQDRRRHRPRGSNRKRWHHSTIALYVFVCCHGFLWTTLPFVAFALVQQQDVRVPIKRAIDASSLSSRQQTQNNGGSVSSATDWKSSSDDDDQNDNDKDTRQESFIRRNKKSNRRGHGRYRYSLENHEEDQRAHLQWMVKTTASILGEDAPPPGKMSPYLVRITYPLMQAWARRAGTVNSSKAPHVVERLLQRLLQERNAIRAAQPQNEEEQHPKQAGENENDDDNAENSAGQQVDVHPGVYNAVLEGWSNSREEGSAERAEEILTQMEQIHGLQPTLRSYNAVIKAYVKNGDRKIAATKVEKLIARMEATGTTMPTQRSYNLLLYALANAPDGTVENAGERAQVVLDRMIQRYKEEGPDCSGGPNVNSFKQVLSAWAKGKDTDFEEHMMKAYQMLLDWPEIEPDTDCFNAVMGGWLRSKDPNPLPKIQNVFDQMKESYESGNDSARPDRVSVNTLQVALNRYRRYAVDAPATLLSYEREYSLQPTRVSQNILMDSIIKSGVADAPEQVLAVLTRMENEFRNGNVEMKPDQCSYIAAIRAYSSYGRADAVEKTEEVLARAWDLHRNYGGDAPNVSLYNSVVNAFASLGDANESLSRVKGILQEMESGDDNGIPRPDLVTYNTVIKSMQNGNKEDGALFAENILTTLESIGERDPRYLPDVYSYTSVITAYARSNSPRKAEKAVEIVKRMITARNNGNKSVRMSLFALNAALNACAFVDGGADDKERAFNLAMELDKMRRELGLTPNQDNTWYGTMLRACSSLLPPSPKREELVDRVFREACEGGCVGRLVLAQMRFAATSRQYERLLGCDLEDRIQLRDLPKDWTCNGQDTRPMQRSFSQ